MELCKKGSSSIHKPQTIFVGMFYILDIKKEALSLTYKFTRLPSTHKMKASKHTELHYSTDHHEIASNHLKQR